MKKLKVMIMTLMMCLVSMSAWGQDYRTNRPNIDASNIITITINTDSIDIELYNQHNGKIDLYINKDLSDFTNNDKIFTLSGVDVTKLNGSLVSGIYIL